MKLSDFRGQVVLIVLWTTDCQSCQKTLPEIQSLHEKYESQGLKVIGVNIEGTSPQAIEYLTKGGFTFAALFDQGKLDSRTARLYQVREVPFALVVDHNGFLRSRGHPQQVSDWFIEKLLKEARQGRPDAAPVLSETKKDDPPPRRVSGTDLQASATHRVEPDYPQAARDAGIEGMVEVEVVIDREGRLVGARVLSGDPALGQAALAAVRQWKFRPILLDAKPAEVIGELRFRFRL